MTTGITIGIVVILAAILVSYIVSSILSGRQNRLLSELSSEEASIQGKCMMSANGIHAPGVAQISNGKLTVHSTLGERIEVPMNEIQVTKESFKVCCTPWVWKRVFHLKVPEVSQFAIGFHPSKADAWRQALEVKA